ncbi:MAG: hypothetical protein QM796_06415 [Chthoniobacteraceae bacterium]
MSTSKNFLLITLFTLALVTTSAFAQSTPPDGAPAGPGGDWHGGGPGGPGGPEGHSPLGQNMKTIAMGFRTLHKQITDPTKKDDSLKIVAKMKDAVKKCETYEPESAGDVPAAEKASYVADFKKQLEGSFRYARQAFHRDFQWRHGGREQADGRDQPGKARRSLEVQLEGLSTASECGFSSGY